jgi:type II secretory pathway component GspD/PulD (secretin)
MTRALAAFALIGLLLFAEAHAETTVVEVIALRHRTAEEVIPLLEPFIGPEGAISGMSGQLIIRATPENLAEIKEILGKIDTAARRLLITVRQNVTRDQLERELAASGNVTIGDHGRVVVRDGGSRDGAAAGYRRGQDQFSGRASSTNTLQQAGDTQQVQVLEGSQAFIQAGTSVPYPERTVVRDRRGVAVSGGTTYRDVTSGFYVLPRLSGDQVILEISPQRATLGEQGRINIQGASTRVSARLGEWIELGGIAQETSEKRTDIASASSRTGTDRCGIFVKVDEVR